MALKTISILDYVKSLRDNGIIPNDYKEVDTDLFGFTLSYKATAIKAAIEGGCDFSFVVDGEPNKEYLSFVMNGKERFDTWAFFALYWLAYNSEQDISLYKKTGYCIGECICEITCYANMSAEQKEVFKSRKLVPYQLFPSKK